MSQTAAGNQEDYQDLASELTTMAATLNEHVARLATEDRTGSVGRILK